MAGIEHCYADVNGIRLHYAIAGRGAPMIFLHGFPEFWYAWKRQLVEFARDHQVVAPDMRGYNLSSKPAEVEQYRLHHLVDDILALAAHLALGKFTLIGHDWGGAVAWRMAIDHPAKLERLVIINAPHPAIFLRELRDNPAQQAASQYMLRFRSAEAEQILSANGYERLMTIILRPLLEKGSFDEDDVRTYLEAWSRPGALTGGLNYYRAAAAGPAPASPGGGPHGLEPVAPDPAASKVRVPTLVIWGEKDQALLTGNLQGLDDFVPRLLIRRIPEGSHWVIHEHGALVNGYIRSFLKEAQT